MIKKEYQNLPSFFFNSILMTWKGPPRNTSSDGVPVKAEIAACPTTALIEGITRKRKKLL